MKTLAFALAMVSSGALLFGLRDLEVDRAELLRERSELREAAAREGEAIENDRERERLLERARDLPGGVLELAVLRELLIGAERGLEIDRISLDFRPESNLPDGGVGGGIAASLVGSFGAVYEYLERVERLRLPLVAAEMSLRPDPDGNLLLTVRYRALWELTEGGGSPKNLAPSDVTRLALWLSGDAHPKPVRNPFGAAVAVEEPLMEEPFPTASPAEVEPLPGPDSERPRLSGYVLARPELEADVDLRVLAAIRFEGELRLVKVGDVFGPFRVERIAARESVVLVDERTGERVKLYLE